ncbi:hypothetical protein [Paeniglutamicibacter psychrophenolicus]|nr:hypothetical protein [Paeniglutamicibacter psychrophenolicus]MDQ0094866.1 hypothetical protein [Paeniglutamicibacter psychrophenolicus]
MLGHPAIRQFAPGRSADSRTMSGYGTTVAVSVLVKVVTLR